MCNPKSIRPGSDFKFEGSQKYGLIFTFESSKAKSNPAEDCKVDPNDGVLKFACVKGLEINDFAEDVNVTIHL